MPAFSALLRRLGKTPLTPVLRYEFGDVSVDFEHKKVSRAGVPLNLAAKEFLLLRQLIDHRGQVLFRERLLSRVWRDQPFIGPRTVDVHVSWLRQKLEGNPKTPGTLSRFGAKAIVLSHERQRRSAGWGATCCRPATCRQRRITLLNTLPAVIRVLRAVIPCR